jgi:hypothetical protein
LREVTVKNLLTTSVVAVLLAVPALAQTNSQPQAMNVYDQQIQQANARLAEMPGIDGNDRLGTKWTAMVAQANANRTGVSVDVAAASKSDAR